MHRVVDMFPVMSVQGLEWRLEYWQAASVQLVQYAECEVLLQVVMVME